MNHKKLTDAAKMKLLTAIVNDASEICCDNYTIERGPTGAIKIHTDTSLSGVLVKDIAELAEVFNWSFGIYTDEHNRPFIHIC